MNFCSKKSLIDQELSKPSNNLYDIITPNDGSIHSTEINHQIIQRYCCSTIVYF